MLINTFYEAHVPIGKTAANKQAALLLSVKYRIQLPDHDFVIVTKHKLTSTVIGLREVKDTTIADRKQFGIQGLQLFRFSL